jgi:protein phosphatase
VLGGPYSAVTQPEEQGSRVEESRLVVGAHTAAGNVRDRNEDLVHHERLEVNGSAGDAFVLAVADGMGGYDRGDVASRMAIDALLDRLHMLDTRDSSLILKQAYRRANDLIYEGGVSQGEENMMGTTLVAGLVRGSDLTIANVGDSRAYLLRAGALTQVTEDHSLIAEQVRMGVLTPDEARSSQHRNIITRALGHRERVDVDGCLRADAADGRPLAADHRRRSRLHSRRRHARDRGDAAA